MARLPQMMGDFAYAPAMRGHMQNRLINRGKLAVNLKTGALAVRL
jgi:hypothetical protein